MSNSYGVSRQKVLDILIREADFEGNTIITEREIGEELGLKSRAISDHICKLEKTGVIKVTRSGGTVSTISLVEE